MVKYLFSMISALNATPRADNKCGYCRNEVGGSSGLELQVSEPSYIGAGN